MIDCGFTSLKKWIALLHSDSLLAFLIGCDVNRLPSLTSYYDFINRLWLRNSSLERDALKHLYRYNFNRKPKKGNLKKGQKLPVRKPGVVKQVALSAKSGRSFASYERLLQKIFVLLAVYPSAECGLIHSSSLTAAGDGTCLPVPSSSYGIKTCLTAIFLIRMPAGDGTAVKKSGFMGIPFTFFPVTPKNTLLICLFTFVFLMQTAMIAFLVWLP